MVSGGTSALRGVQIIALLLVNMAFRRGIKRHPTPKQYKKYGGSASSRLCGVEITLRLRLEILHVGWYGIKIILVVTRTASLLSQVFQARYECSLGAGTECCSKKWVAAKKKESTPHKSQCRFSYGAF